VGGALFTDHVPGRAGFCVRDVLAEGRIRSVSVHVGVSRLRQETSFSRRSRSLARAGQLRMACWQDSGSTPQRGQDTFGFALNLEGWAAR